MLNFSKSDLGKQGFTFYYGNDRVLHVEKSCLKRKFEKKINLSLAQAENMKVHTLCLRRSAGFPVELDDLVTKVIAFESIFKKNLAMGLSFQLGLLFQHQVTTFIESIGSAFNKAIFSDKAGNHISKLQSYCRRLDNALTEEILEHKNEVYLLISLNLLDETSFTNDILCANIKEKAFKSYINFPGLLSDDLLAKIFVRNFAVEQVKLDYPEIKSLAEQDFNKLLEELDGIVDRVSKEPLGTLLPDFAVDLSLELDKADLVNSALSVALFKIHSCKGEGSTFIIKSLPEKYGRFISN